MGYGQKRISINFWNWISSCAVVNGPATSNLRKYNIAISGNTMAVPVEILACRKYLASDVHLLDLPVYEDY